MKCKIFLTEIGWGPLVRQSAIANELAKHGVAVNAIQAGVTDTEALRKIPGSDNMIDNAINNNPHKRLTLTEDVGKIIANIGLSNDSWMTGNTIMLDG